MQSAASPIYKPSSSDKLFVQRSYRVALETQCSGTRAGSMFQSYGRYIRFYY